MKKRRFSITYHEGEIAILALSALVDELADPEYNGSAYWEWTRRAAKELLDKLKNYKWEV